jgi:hypothetical protein
MKEGTNLFDNVNAHIVGFKFTKEPPEGYAAEGNPIFAVIGYLLDGDGPADDRTVSQSYSLGASAGDNFTIGDDGFGLVPVEGIVEPAIRKDSKFGTFMSVLETSGVSTTITQAGDMSALTAGSGLYGHFKRIADKERNFGEDARTRPGQKKSKFPPSTLVCVKLLDEKAGTGASATTTTTASTKAAAPAMSAPAGATKGNGAVAAGDLDTVTSQYLETVLKAAKGNSVQRSNLTLLLSRAALAGNEPNRNDIAKRGTDETYLSELAELGIVVYDPAAKPQIVSLPAAA